jgi:hypothetical protein
VPKQTNKEKVLTALLSSPSIAGASRTSGLSEETIYRYLKDTEFKTEYTSARRRIFEQNIFKLQLLHTGAVDTLERNLNCEIPSVEVRAAQIIIESNRRDFELFDVLSRLEVLESEYEHSIKIEENGNRNYQKRF